MSPLSPVAIRFRQIVLNATWHHRMCGYISRDTSVGVCPVCHEWGLSIRFHGSRPRVDLWCPTGCDVREIAAAIRRRAA